MCNLNSSGVLQNGHKKDLNFLNGDCHLKKRVIINGNPVIRSHKKYTVEPNGRNLCTQVRLHSLYIL